MIVFGTVSSIDNDVEQERKLTDHYMPITGVGLVGRKPRI